MSIVPTIFVICEEISGVTYLCFLLSGLGISLVTS